MAGVFLIFMLISIVCFLWGIVAPDHFTQTARIKKPLARHHLGIFFGLAAAVFFVLIAIAAPKQQPLALSTTPTSKQTQVQSKPTITTTTETSTSPIAFTTKTENNSSLAKGQTKIIQAGQDGVQTTTYLVTYTDGVQTSKDQQSQIITTQPLQQIVENGTYMYVAPVPTPSPAPTTPSCQPHTNGGNCYEPGEYCRNIDHGITGIAGDGKSIVCAYNNGWRWEPN